MKCESCGAALSLDAQYCPYCGRENAAVKQHVKDMAHYQGEFEATKKNVYEKTHTYTHNTVKIAIVAVLAIVWVILVIMVSCAWEIENAVSNARNSRDFAKHEAQILEYMEEEEYYALSVYCEKNDIQTYDTKFEKYEPVISLANSYRWAYEYFLKIMSPAEYYEENMDTYVGYLADYVGYFYESYSRDWEEYDYNNRYDMDVLQPELDKMEAKMQVLLRAYIGLTEEEAKQFPTMTTG